jgi:hypothetical protein
VSGRLVDDHEPAGLLDERRIVSVSSGARQRGSITSGVTPSPEASCSGRLQCLPEHVAERDDRDVAALADDVRPAERDDVLSLGHVAVLEREQVMVEEDDWVVVADRRRSSAPSRRRRRPGSATFRPGTPMNMP